MGRRSFPARTQAAITAVLDARNGAGPDEFLASALEGAARIYQGEDGVDMDLTACQAAVRKQYNQNALNRKKCKEMTKLRKMHKEGAPMNDAQKKKLNKRRAGDNAISKLRKMDAEKAPMDDAQREKLYKRRALDNATSNKMTKLRKMDAEKAPMNDAQKKKLNKRRAVDNATSNKTSKLRKMHKEGAPMDEVQREKLDKLRALNNATSNETSKLRKMHKEGAPMDESQREKLDKRLALDTEMPDLLRRQRSGEKLASHEIVRLMKLVTASRKATLKFQQKRDDINEAELRRLMQAQVGGASMLDKIAKDTELLANAAKSAIEEERLVYIFNWSGKTYQAELKSNLQKLVSLGGDIQTAKMEAISEFAGVATGTRVKGCGMVGLGGPWVASRAVEHGATRAVGLKHLGNKTSGGGGGIPHNRNYGGTGVLSMEPMN